MGGVQLRGLERSGRVQMEGTQCTRRRRVWDAIARWALVSGGEGVRSGRAAAMTLRQSGAEEGRGCSESDHQARAGTGA
jgi:hypothetical protein